MPSKRVRPRPNQITVNLAKSQRDQFDELLEYYREAYRNPFYSQIELIQSLIRERHWTLLADKSKNISRN